VTYEEAKKLTARGDTNDEEPDMKKLLSLGLVSLFIGMTAMTLSGSQDRGGDEGVRGQFVGAWRLAWLEEEGADGKIHRADCTGLLVYTRDGHMSVQVMHRNPPAATNAAPVQYAQGGYEASFGTYEIDDGAHSFTYHVEGALVRSLVGKDLPRAFEFSGKQLIVKSTRPEEHWRVAWEHD
jgi:lipocalin-like protein